MNDFVDRFNSTPTVYRYLLLVLAAVGIGVVFYFALYQPLEGDIQRKSTALKALETKRIQLEEVKSSKTQLEVNLRKLEAQLLIAQEKLPQNAEIPSLLQRIHNQAKTAGLDIQKFGRDKDKVQDFYVEIPVQMEMAGSYDELANFFHYIGRMTRIVNVRDISLKRTKAGLSSDGELEVKALATTFRYKSKDDKGKQTRRGRRRR